MANQSMNQFCPECRAKNELNANFCSQCGTKLSSVAQRLDFDVDDSLMRINDLSKRISKGYKVSLSGAILTIFCFFMPWFLVFYGMRPIAEMSGWELAAGIAVGRGYLIQEILGRPILLLVLLASIVILLLAYLAYRRGEIKPLDRYGLIGLGVLSLLILFIQFSKLINQAVQEGLYFESQFGFWGIVFGYTAVIIGGILNFEELTKSTKRSQNTN